MTKLWHLLISKKMSYTNACISTLMRVNSLLYVNNILFVGNDVGLFRETKQILSDIFEMKDLGKASLYSTYKFIETCLVICWVFLKKHMMIVSLESLMNSCSLLEDKFSKSHRPKMILRKKQWNKFLLHLQKKAWFTHKSTLDLI